MKRNAPWLILALLLGYLFLSQRIRADERHRLATAAWRDSLAALDSTLQARDVVIARLAADTLRHGQRYRSLRHDWDRLSAAHELEALTVIADTTASDSLRGLVQRTVNLWNQSATACNAALSACDSLLAGKDAIIGQLDLARSELHDALHRTNDLWLQAERRARRKLRVPCFGGGFAANSAGNGFGLFAGICYTP